MTFEQSSINTFTPINNEFVNINFETKIIQFLDEEKTPLLIINECNYEGNYIKSPNNNWILSK